MKKIALFLAICCLISCKHIHKKEENEIKGIFKETAAKYDSLKTRLDANFTHHFPNTIDTNNISIVSSISNTSDVIRFIVTNRMKTEECKLLINKYDSIYIAKYNANDTCLIIPNRHITRVNVMDGEYETSIGNYNECGKLKFPVPNFWMSNYVAKNTGINLSDDFYIYILDAKPGVFTDKNHKGNCKDMPEKWKNGFSKGVAISEEKSVIIYWVIIW